MDTAVVTAELTFWSSDGHQQYCVQRPKVRSTEAKM